MTNPGREVIRTRCRRGASFDSHTVLALLNRLEAAERRAENAERERDAKG